MNIDFPFSAYFEQYESQKGPQIDCNTLTTPSYVPNNSEKPSCGEIMTYGRIITGKLSRKMDEQSAAKLCGQC
jgi:hypothetical protein